MIYKYNSMPLGETMRKKNIALELLQKNKLVCLFDDVALLRNDLWQKKLLVSIILVNAITKKNCIEEEDSYVFYSLA